MLAGKTLCTSGYSNGVDGFQGTGDTIIREGKAGRILDFSQTALSGIAEVDAAGGDNTVVVSDQSDGRCRGGTGKNVFVTKGSPGQPVTVSIVDFDQGERNRIDLSSLSTTFGAPFARWDKPSGDTTIAVSCTASIRLVSFALARLGPSGFIF